MTDTRSQPTTASERNQIVARLSDLQAKQEAATGWGAAVGAREEEIRSLESRLLRIDSMTAGNQPSSSVSKSAFDICVMIVEEECYLDAPPADGDNYERAMHEVGLAIRDRIRCAQQEAGGAAQAKPDCGAKEAIKALMDDRRVALGSSHRKRLATVMAALSPAVWPSGCHDPDSCVRHLACMYVQCARHGNDGNEVAAEISACSVSSTTCAGAVTKHSGTFLGYRDERGNEMHCAHAFCPHQAKCHKGCTSPVAISSTTSGSAAK